MPRPLCGAADAGPSLDEDGLRARIREGLAEGLLPATDGTAWAGFGTGQPCRVCGVAIQPSEIEYEVAGREGRLYAHLACYAIWCDESFDRRHDGGPAVTETR